MQGQLVYLVSKLKITRECQVGCSLEYKDQSDLGNHQMWCTLLWEWRTKKTQHRNSNSAESTFGKCQTFHTQTKTQKIRYWRKWCQYGNRHVWPTHSWHYSTVKRLGASIWKLVTRASIRRLVTRASTRRLVTRQGLATYFQHNIWSHSWELYKRKKSLKLKKEKH